MLYGEKIKIKQLIPLIMNCGFKKCELWTMQEYIQVHCKNNKFRSHQIASKKMNLLNKMGLSYTDAQKLIIMEGNQKINKSNLSLLGMPIWTGTIEALSNKQSFWNKCVLDCNITGLFKHKIQIIIENINI